MTPSVRAWLCLALAFLLIGGGLWKIGEGYMEFLQWLGAVIACAGLLCLAFAGDEFERQP